MGKLHDTGVFAEKTRTATVAPAEDKFVQGVEGSDRRASLTAQSSLQQAIGASPRVEGQRFQAEQVQHSPRVEALRASQRSLLGSSGGAAIQREKFPEHRIDPHIHEPTEEEESAFAEKYNYGDGGTGDEDRERKDMLNRAEYARALDRLANVEDYYDPLNGARCDSTQMGTYRQGALSHYHGTREAGHEIWLGLQANLDSLLETAFSKGYAVNRDDIQALILAAALAKTLFESNALGSAGRSITLRR